MATGVDAFVEADALEREISGHLGASFMGGDTAVCTPKNTRFSSTAMKHKPNSWEPIAMASSYQYL